ncbi:hypothetical protein BDV39DRAFT_109450 [Aspergillus sergii]|uniref:Uncharacterized protein n=1 Tax=Aspergillus sergii TaxID=1034303 RepID=A0A5N6WWW4_9EURO|nr:hypothetical protein BDV39DRAFT_109450 [Aspergillus sergii]
MTSLPSGMEIVVFPIGSGDALLNQSGTNVNLHSTGTLISIIIPASCLMFGSLLTFPLLPLHPLLSISLSLLFD